MKLRQRIRALQIIAFVGTVLTLPIEVELRQQIIDAFNNYRANLGSSNMESITEWSMDLEEEAQNLGAACVSPDAHAKYGVVYLSSATAITPDGFPQLFKTYEANYNYDTNACWVVDSKCDVYRQILWYRGGKIGCASTLCIDEYNRNTFSYLCLFEQKAKTDQIPYAKGAAGTFCASDEVTRCPTCLCVPVNSTASKAPTYCGGSAPSNLIPLYRMVHQTTAVTVLTAEETPSLGAVYVNRGIFGYVSASMDSNCDRLTPLIQMSPPTNYDYVHVIGEDAVSYYSQKNYRFVRVLGYVVSREDLCGANATAHQFIKSSTYNYYTNNATEAAVILQRTYPYAAYYFVEKPFAFWA